MKLTLSTVAISAVALAFADAAQAGDTPVYADTPDWVEIVSIDGIEPDEANDLILSDRQIRIEEGQLWEYYDTVYRVSGLSDLSNVGTLTAQWLPDKGDLIVHEISIIRDGETIDVLANGGELEVLRRERLLERRILDGSLTATMAVPGLAVGDKLRMRYSTTNSDQALGREVQSQNMLWREPSKRGVRVNSLGSGTEADLARIRVSWPEDLPVQYQAGPNFELEEVEKRNGYLWLEVELPLPTADPVPPNAPLRFRRPTVLQVGTFSGWSGVSSTMAPYYQTDGALDGLDDLLAKVDAIGALSISDLEKAVEALELVQEDIRYLANGLDGGNYLPQDVSLTWEKKYGDCKAKTVMLLALLDHLGIDAEAVLVSTNRGNAVPESLPIPGAFNHVLVRAVIEGQEYFLDGTSMGANLKTVGNVPPFEYYLAIQEDGAELAKINQTLPRVAEVEMHFEADSSAGIDLPTIGTVTMIITGARAAQMNAEADKMNDALKGTFGKSLGRGGQVVDAKIVQGDDDSESILTISGIMPALFKFDGVRGEFTPGRVTKRASFSPNRSRRQWREIPVAVANPNSTINSVRAKLPFAVSEMEIKGSFDFQADAAGKLFTRTVKAEGNEIFVFEQETSLGGEISPDQFLQERRKASKIASEKLVFVAPDDAPRRWRFAGGADRSALEQLEAAMAQVIANDPEEVEPYTARANFRRQTYDFAGALEDFSAAINLEASAGLFRQRARMHSQLRDWDSASADLEEAYGLDPTPARAMDLAEALANTGRVDEAIEMLELEDGDTKTQQSLAVAIAALDAQRGDVGAGLDRIAVELEEDPNNPRLLNEKCWFIGTWKFQLDEGEEACKLAVERGKNAAQVLDSRAMYLLRVGDLEGARSDIEEALKLAPWKAASLLLRGLIKQQQGDDSSAQDIADAIAREPALADMYTRWGFSL